MSDFSLYLISNGSTDSFPNNTLTHFKNKIPVSVNLETDKKWEMALESIGFSSNFTNVIRPEKSYFPSFIISTCKNKNIFDCKAFEDICNEQAKNDIANESNDCKTWYYH